MELGSAGQDGTLAGAYMYDGTVYLVSSHSVTLEEGETDGFLPKTYVGDTGTEISGEEMCIRDRYMPIWITIPSCHRLTQW